MRRFGGTFAGALVYAIAVSVAMLPAHGEAPAAGGWIKLFDGETLFGWNQFGDAQWKVADGAMVCEAGSGGWIATTSQFADFELVAKVRIKGETTSGLAVRAGLEGHPTENGTMVIPLAEPKGSTPGWHEINVLAQSGKVTVKVDGKDIEVKGAFRKRGYIGVQYHHVGGKVEVSEMRLRPLDLKPIFNGKNLDGWNIIPEHKSEFKVVDGALNITNGNGQIETKGVYKDFMVQLDIISNGDNLNSGVFFRGPVGVFWKGYESQVRNQWEGDDRSKPVDYGTGAIYGDQAARRVVSSDYKWWQQTIVCEGNHMAVWVDGYQVSDFTDTRPISIDAKTGKPDSNGKAGYVPGPGTIHLQGHDPKTNLSFKNINVQEYPKAK